MINRIKKPKVLLVGVDYNKESQDWTIADSLSELHQLAITANLDIKGQIIQHLSEPQHTYYLGSGKLAEVKQIISQEEIDLIITDDELLPHQQKALEKALNLLVIDRTALILDIFAARARTHEAQLQVELAQLQYILPRLTRQWTHFPD